MSLSPTIHGYDSPISSKGEDLLDRWRIAAEILETIEKAPEDWSVRIGIYGKWGEGKTSVLNFAKKMAEGNGHVVAWFNPWSTKDHDSLWTNFSSAIFASLDKAGIKVEGSKVIKAKIWGKKALDPIRHISEFHNYAKAAVGGVLSVVSSMLNVNSQVFKNIKKSLGNRRLIVIVDDLDRTSPDILPELFLSLREVLDLPGFSFLLAFDVDIVARALAEKYTAWGKGHEFLEKVIDFPIILPALSDDQKRTLLNKEMSEYCDFVPRNMIEKVFDLLPQNPRKLKLFTRYLWTLKKQINRHNDEELDWISILIWGLIKLESANFLRAFLKLYKTLEILSTWRLTAHLREEKNGQQKKQDALKEQLDKLFDDIGIEVNDERRERISQLVNALGERANVFSTEQMLYMVHLSDKPHSVTWKEFYQAYNVWENIHSFEEINKWVLNHSQKLDESVKSVAVELFKASIHYRLRQLDDAASVKTLQEHIRIMSGVRDSLLLIEKLYLHGMLCVGETFYQTPDNFQLIWNMIQKWIHFRKNEDDLREREYENTVLEKCVKHANIDPIRFFEIIAPWDQGTYPFEAHGKFIDEQRTSLNKIVEPLAADYVIKKFSENGGIASLWGAGQRIAEKYLLFNVSSALWSGERKSHLFRLIEAAHNDPIIHSNCVEFVNMVSHYEREGIGVPHGRDKVTELIKDKEISGVLWKAVVARPIQYRGLSKMREIRKQFAEIAETDEHLPIPEWLEIKNDS